MKMGDCFKLHEGVDGIGAKRERGAGQHVRICLETQTQKLKLPQTSTPEDPPGRANQKRSARRSRRAGIVRSGFSFVVIVSTKRTRSRARRCARTHVTGFYKVCLCRREPFTVLLFYGFVVPATFLLTRT